MMMSSVGNFPEFNSGRRIHPMFASSAQRYIMKFHDKVDQAAGVEITPVYLSTSGNLRKWQVKKIDACCWRQARKSLVIQNLSIWIMFSSIFHPQSCSLVQFLEVLPHKLTW